MKKSILSVFITVILVCICLSCTVLASETGELIKAEQSDIQFLEDELSYKYAMYLNDEYNCENNGIYKLVENIVKSIIYTNSESNYTRSIKEDKRKAINEYKGNDIEDYVHYKCEIKGDAVDNI